MARAIRHAAIAGREAYLAGRMPVRFLADLTPERLVAPLSYTTTGGQSFTQPLWQPLLHVVNHGTHHRSEAADLLTRLGHPPPPLDLIIYYRETQP